MSLLINKKSVKSRVRLLKLHFFENNAKQTRQPRWGRSHSQGSCWGEVASADKASQTSFTFSLSSGKLGYNSGAARICHITSNSEALLEDYKTLARFGCGGKTATC